MRRLGGAHAHLEPLSQAHCDGLTEAVKDGELWKLWYTFIPRAEDMRKEIDRRLGLQAAGSMLPFTVLDTEGKIAGMTTYMNVDTPNRRVEIGSTWYARRVQRSAVNTQCKLLLLTHAFEKLDCIAVEFRTHFFNHQSRRGSASAPSRTGSCATIRLRRTARCATLWSTALSPANGQR